MALHVGDLAKRVQDNRQMLAHQVGVVSWQWLNQVHGAKCWRVSSVTAQPLPTVEADAAVTTLAEVACAVLTADCLPILLCNKHGSQVAAIHAGWRGLVAGVIGSTYRCFEPTDKVMAYLGPAIGPQSFEVGEEVKQAFVAVMGDAVSHYFRPNEGRRGHYFANLYGLASKQLEVLGAGEIYGGEYCTYSDPRFYSFRRSGTTGRIVSAIWLANEAGKI
jgi:YfiH family protein